MRQLDLLLGGNGNLVFSKCILSFCCWHFNEPVRHINWSRRNKNFGKLELTRGLEILYFDIPIYIYPVEDHGGALHHAGSRNPRPRGGGSHSLPLKHLTTIKHDRQIHRMQAIWFFFTIFSVLCLLWLVNSQITKLLINHGKIQCVDQSLLSIKGKRRNFRA